MKAYSKWLNTKEGIRWRNEQSKKMRINNPMFNKKISEKSGKNKNYQEIGKKISKTRIKRIKEGKIKILPPSKDTKLKLRKSKLGENNPMWKGEKVGLYALHEWIKNHKPKPKLCEICEICKKRKINLMI